MGSSSLTRDSTSGVQTTRKVPTLVDIHQRLPFTFIMLFLHRDLSQNHPDTETALRLLWVRCCVSLPQPVSSWETIKGLLASLLTQPLPPLLAEVFCCSIFLSAIASCIFLPYWAHSLSQLSSAPFSQLVMFSLLSCSNWQRNLCAVFMWTLTQSLKMAVSFSL